MPDGAATVVPVETHHLLLWVLAMRALLFLTTWCDRVAMVLVLTCVQLRHVDEV
jgi:hypothetical protein